jgi:hypothetical protein
MTYQNNVSLATNIVAFVVVPDDRRLTDWRLTQRLDLDSTDLLDSRLDSTAQSPPPPTPQPSQQQVTQPEVSTAHFMLCFRNFILIKIAVRSYIKAVTSTSKIDLRLDGLLPAAGDADWDSGHTKKIISHSE